jgi:hypothetical protein
VLAVCPRRTRSHRINTTQRTQHTSLSLADAVKQQQREEERAQERAQLAPPPLPMDNEVFDIVSQLMRLSILKMKSTAHRVCAIVFQPAAQQHSGRCAVGFIRSFRHEHCREGCCFQFQD